MAILVLLCFAIGLLAWQRHELREPIVPPTAASRANAQEAPEATRKPADDKVIVVTAYCFTEGGRRTCYAQ